ncbi:MAG: tetratricopeptide repeat protein, partial [Verrucomicrobia bacterium]|nr:tetratricopeptide repeat protein [Verrucomicrobiota bacterium]
MPAGNSEQRKLAAIMFTDMVGYSALSQRNEKLAQELLEEHRALLRPLFPRFNGTEIKTIGDAFLVEFHSALEAAQCGIEIQRALAKRNHDVPADRRIEIKIGIHIGDVVHRGGDVYGDGVNIASRIEPLAGAGGICVSMDVERQIRNALEARFEKLAPTELKNISVAMDLFRIVLPWETQSSSRRESAHSERAARDDEHETKIQRRLTSAATKFGLVTLVVLFVAGLGWWLIHQSRQTTKQIAQSSTNSPSAATAPVTSNTPPVVAAPAADQKSIAVLPFVNMSADKDNEYFSDGITEEILNALARTPGLRVAARTSAFSFKGKNESIQRIGELLKVGVVLEGSVRRAGNQLRITAQLINVADGFHLWSDTFDRKAEDVFAIQIDVAQRVQEVLQVKLLAGGSPNATLAGTDNLEAYDLYLRGRHFWNQRTGVDIERAVGLFQQATEKDPKFAAAYAGLASSYALLPIYAAVPKRDALPKARAAARRALELDGRLAEAHTVLAGCAWHDWDWVEAEQEFQEALRLNPNHGTSHHWYALLLRDQGKMEQALAEMRKAQAVDSLSPINQCKIGEVLYSAGRYDEALVGVDEALKLSPDFLPAYGMRGQIFLTQKKTTEAIAELEKVRKKAGDTPYALGYLGYAYARAGRTNEARQILEKLNSVSTNGGAASIEIAMVHLGLAGLDQVFVRLEHAVE